MYKELSMMSCLGVYDYWKLCDILSNWIIWINSKIKKLSMVRLIGRLRNGGELTLTERDDTSVMGDMIVHL